MSKSGGMKEACYANGGAVLGRTKDFMKTPDRFRDSQFKKGTEDVYAKNTGSGQPKARESKVIKK